MSLRVRVEPYQADWPHAFEAECRRLQQALGDVVHALHHIGSTSVPGLAAKPIIDMLLEVPDLATLDARSEALAVLGYEALGEYGLPGRRYFRKSDALGQRSHHLHAFAAAHAEARRHLVFRDYLIAHPEVAAAYGALKLALAQAHPEDIEAYMDGKDPFIKNHEARALRWAAQR
ncbi:MAG TPA: GrpB family protein [Burkholderiaceae bacterium]|nr:GrpB family protein [Burkholderiaceae bacterium]